ncbi:MAG: aldehyde dehydrogenase family protein [Acidobacteriota bacterium]
MTVAAPVRPSASPAPSAAARPHDAPPPIDADTFPDSTDAQQDAAIADLNAHRADWAALGIRDRRAILGELLKDFTAIADRWADAVRRAEGIPADIPTAAEEWLAGPYLILRNIRLLAETLADIERHGAPQIPGPVRTRADGRVTARVFPQTAYDRIFYGGVRAEIWLPPGTDRATIASSMARAYRRTPEPGTCLILGAGNVSSIGPMDALYKLFVDKQAVLYKMHPLNPYLGPLMEAGFRALLDWGVLRVVSGGVDVGARLVTHDGVDEIHITGSDKTVEAIAFGTGAEGAKRKKAGTPRLDKPISSELGNVSPVIVVPGPWTPAEIDYHGENLAAMLVNNGGFNCNAARVIVTHKDWPQRAALLDAVRRHLLATPLRQAYYPGAAERHARFVEAHPEAERFGQPRDGELPWTLITDLDPDHRDDICFQTEAFCAVFGETALAASDTADFLAKAVAFCNDTLWGTLNATLLVHPTTARRAATRGAVDRAIADLRYGTVAINNWAAVGYGLVITSWGAYPGHDLQDIQSGTGVVHNTLMFDDVEKTVVHLPFVMRPKPPWFPSHRTSLGLAKRLTAFEAAPSPAKLPGILWQALRA